jgi:hypothetical protein
MYSKQKMTRGSSRGQLEYTMATQQHVARPEPQQGASLMQSKIVSP